MDKTATTSRPIDDLIAKRWSPLAFADRAVSEDDVKTLLEAARWAPSSYNEQPWSYVVGHQGDEVFEKLAASLVEGNAWAKDAPVLMLSVAKTFFEHKHQPNRHYMHDVGAASALLCVQATSMGMVVHQMAGFDIEAVRKSFNIGDDYEPAAMIAVGYLGDVADLPNEEWKARDEAPRSRKDLGEMFWEINL